MGSYRTSKMSLLAQHDDLCRYYAVLAPGCDKEFKMFVENQKHIHQKAKELEAENKRLLEKVNILETEKLRHEAQLKHARNLLIFDDEKYRKLEQEKISLERQISLIKELLADQNGIDNETKERLVHLGSVYSQQNDIASRLTTIEESGSLLSSYECDETADGLETSTHKPCLERIPEQNRKSVERKYADDLFTEQKDFKARQSVVTFRSSSEPNSSSIEDPAPRQIIRSDSEQIKEYASEIRRTSMPKSRTSLSCGRYSNGTLSRTHTFVAKTFIRPEKCNPCGKVIRFCKQALKCSDCRINCHPECKEQCPLPCIPVISTTARNRLDTIADFTSFSSPMIPSLIVHCVNEIEIKGLESIGLYRVPGSERKVRDLKEKFLKGKNVPLLIDIDVHVLCGTVKEFLRSLKDTLITKAAWQTFVDLSNKKNETTRLNLLYDAVCNLPQPNRETLAFLVLHLQRVAASPLCKMPISNLAKVFGPTIVGYSAEEPADSNMLTETKQQNKVMEDLLKIPAISWQALLSASNIYSSASDIPDSLPAPITSRLGPIYSSGENITKFIPVIKTNIPNRSARAGVKDEKRQFFLSPILK